MRHERTRTRREILAGVALTLAWVPHLPVGWLAAWAVERGRPDRGPQTGQPEEDWVVRARAEIPAASGSTYFQTGGIGPSPSAVMAEVKSRLDFENQGPADPRVSGAMGRIEPALRAHLGRALGADTEEVALTHSTSEGINIAVWSRNWSQGDEVIISNQEHPSNVIPWYVMRDRSGS